MTAISEWSLVNTELENAIAAAGSAQAWAKQVGVSPQFVCDVRQGRRAPTDRLAHALGWRRVVSFARIEE